MYAAVRTTSAASEPTLEAVRKRGQFVTPQKYQRVILDHVGGPDVLHVVEEDLPVPTTGQARVRILAADVSFSDVNLRRGMYPGAPKAPFTPGYAMVGVVDQLGPEPVQGGGRGALTAPLAIGQPVAALTFYGSYSQFLCVPVQQLVAMPRGLDPAEAVCLVLNYVTAYQMLHRIARVVPADRILVHGAAGGVGTAFLELGRLAGLTMYGTASHGKHDLVRRLGGIPIDYRTEDFVTRVATLTGGKGVDAAFDPIGGAHLSQSASAVRRGGSLVAYGYYATANRKGNALLDVLTQYARMALWSLPPYQKRTTFYDVRALANRHPDWFRADLTELFNLLAAGKLHPVIAERLSLQEAEQAHRRIEQADVYGKLVLIPNP